MTKVSAVYTCLACDHSSRFTFKKPNHHTITRHRWTCPDCSSRFFLFINKVKGTSGANLKINIQQAILDLSTKAVELLDAKQKENQNVAPSDPGPQT